MRRGVPDGGGPHENPPRGPGATAEPAEHRDRDRLRDRRAGLGPGMAEIEKRRAGLFQMLRLLDEILWRALVAMEFGEHRNSPLSHSADKLGGSEKLHQVGAALLDQAHGGVGVFPFRQIAAQERALDAAAHRLAYDEHLVEGDLAFLPAPEVDADGVAHGDEVHAGAVRDLRDLVVPGDARDDLFPLALHLLQAREAHQILYPFSFTALSPQPRSTVPASICFIEAVSFSRIAFAEASTRSAMSCGTATRPSASPTMMSPGLTGVPPIMMGTLISPGPFLYGPRCVTPAANTG